jgi:acyl carrier protein
MTLDEFVKAFAAEFDDTPEEQFTPSTNYKELDEWGSLVALSIISMVDDEMDKRLTGADLRSCSTIEELFNLVEAK